MTGMMLFVAAFVIGISIGWAIYLMWTSLH